MATQSGRPPGDGSAERLRETRESRSSKSSQAFVVMLAAVAAATVIYDRFHVNINAEVAPRAQFLRDGTIGMGTDTSAHRVIFDSSEFTTRNVSAQNELVTRRGRDQHNALSAASFTASYFSNSSPICASSLITSKSAVFDRKLITSSSKVSQNRIVDGEIEKIEGGGDCRLQLTRCGVEILRLPLHVETTKEGGSRGPCS